MSQVVYVKGISKIDRIHHRFLSKKRRWLMRQIDPTKLYMKAIGKEEPMDCDDEISQSAETRKDGSSSLAYSNGTGNNIHAKAHEPDDPGINEAQRLSEFDHGDGTKKRQTPELRDSLGGLSGVAPRRSHLGSANLAAIQAELHAIQE
jgi:hypothetical protein